MWCADMDNKMLVYLLDVDTTIAYTSEFYLYVIVHCCGGQLTCWDTLLVRFTIIRYIGFFSSDVTSGRTIIPPSPAHVCSRNRCYSLFGISITTIKMIFRRQTLLFARWSKIVSQVLALGDNVWSRRQENQCRGEETSTTAGFEWRGTTRWGQLSAS